MAQGHGRANTFSSLEPGSNAEEQLLRGRGEETHILPKIRPP